MPVSIVFKGISPKRSFASLGAKVVAQLKRQLERDAEAIQADFEKTTATWEHEVAFEIRMLESGGAAVAMVGTDDEIYQYVDRGTRPHIIRPKQTRGPGGRFGKRGTLIFQTGYKAKTSPGQIGSSSGGASGPVVGAKIVSHPGTQARKFSETIQAKWQREIPRHAMDAVKGAIESW